jgi:ribosomal protein S10
MFLLTIKIESKNKNSLKKFVKLVTKLCKKKNFKSTFVSYLNKKNKNKNFSVLTSPNANKNAQEQFIFKTYSKQINIFGFKIERFLIVFKKFKLFLFTDVKIKLNFFLSKKFIKKTVVKTFDPENFNLRLCKFKNKNK